MPRFRLLFFVKMKASLLQGTVFGPFESHHAYWRKCWFQVCVEDLLVTKIIKSARSIRRSLATDVDRKCRECQMSTLIILELETLRHEMSSEVIALI